MINKAIVALGAVAAAAVTILVFANKANASTVKGHIVINTIPSGASISVNGSSIGQSPKTIDVDPGTYAIIINLTGYNDVSTSVIVAAGSTHTLNVSLTLVGSGWTPIDIVWS